MVYKAAIIGCHGVGKTTLAKRLENKGFKVFNEAVINKFTDKNFFLNEVQMINDNILINEAIGREESVSISDRFAFLDILIYVEGFYELGWITAEQRRILYFLVNHAGHDWIFPEKLLCMNDDKQLIIDNIRRRGRKGLKESDEKYLDTIHGLFEKFYSNELIFEHLNPELGEKIMRIPKHLIKGMDDLNKVMKLLEE
ncbi:hypothetical protein COS83_03830 [archaeon CG07_land_8_20_14_0_80_38_8]|nr:MAG: hypothetical protein COS83_03830 [archaeon CG07_land_8_20_14_0_80_38_8]